MRTRLKATADKEGKVTLSQLDDGNVYARRETCRACGHLGLEPVLSLGNQYLVGFVPEVDLNLPRAPLDLCRCGKCGLLQLGHTVSRDLLYREFWYRSSVNQTMRDALTDLMRSAEKYATEGTWLDIGANDGFLLSKVPSNFKKIACEPALNFADDLDKIADVSIMDYFSADPDCLRDNRKGLCDVITSAAMFYDLDEPLEFVTDIADCLAVGGVWINQLNDAPTMLKRNAFDAVCHEHLCYYDLHSLKALYARASLSIVDITFNEVNGGSVRVFAQKESRHWAMPLRGIPAVTAEDCTRFANRVEKWRSRMLDTIQSWTGKTWLYGASTKGCCLLQYLDANGAFIGIADRNPAKFGLRMAGSWLPIMPEDEMRAERPKYLVCLPWAFRDEFMVRERELLDAGTTFVFPLPNIELAL